MKRPATMSLAVVITCYTALVIAGGMTVYAVFQYLSTPEKTVLGLILQHGLHVLALGTVIYLALNIVLHRKVTRPIGQLTLDLYAISKGNFRPVTVESGITEIQAIAEGVSLLIKRIAGSRTGPTALELSKCSSRLRARAKRSEAMDGQDRQVLMDTAERIDTIIRELSMRSLEADFYWETSAERHLYPPHEVRAVHVGHNE